MYTRLGVTDTKTTKFLKFPNQNENKGKHNSRSKLWNKKNKKKNTTHGKQKSNKILLQRRNKTKLWQENVPKINVEQIKNNVEFIPSGHLIQRSFFKNFKLTCDPCSPMCAHVHPCVNYEWVNIIVFKCKQSGMDLHYVLNIAHM